MFLVYSWIKVRNNNFSWQSVEFTFYSILLMQIQWAFGSYFLQKTIQKNKVPAYNLKQLEIAIRHIFYQIQGKLPLHYETVTNLNCTDHYEHSDHIMNTVIYCLHLSFPDLFLESSQSSSPINNSGSAFYFLLL